MQNVILLRVKTKANIKKKRGVEEEIKKKKKKGFQIKKEILWMGIDDHFETLDFVFTIQGNFNGL